MILSALNYSTSGVWVAVLGNCGLETVMLSLTRLVFVVLICLAVCLIRRTDLRLTRAELRNHIIFGCLGLGMTTYLYDCAARAMSVGPTALCHYTYPLIVAVFSGFIQKEKFGKWKAVAAVLLFAGLGLTSGGGAVTAKGIAFALASAFSFALYVYSLDHTTMHDEDPFKLNFYNALFSCLLMLMLSVVTRGFAVPTQGSVYLSMLLAAATGLLGGVFLALTLIPKAEKKNTLDWVTKGVTDSAAILAITGAGGAFGAILKCLPIADSVGGLVNTGIGVFIPFIIACILKLAMGASTVAMITTASMMAPLMETMGFTSPVAKVLVVLAIGAGSMVASHANDSYFWVVSQFSDMKTEEAYKCQTGMTAVMGITIIILLFIVSLFI